MISSTYKVEDLQDETDEHFPKKADSSKQVWSDLNVLNSKETH